jgi:IS30 family transposase
MTERIRRSWRKALEFNTLWALWRQGLSQVEISEELGLGVMTVNKTVVRVGGVAPPPRKRRSDALTDEEREDISRGLLARLSIREIGRRLCRSASTISREIRRNARTPGAYRAVSAERQAWRRARRPKRCKLAMQHKLRRTVAAKLRSEWSPQQIANWLRVTFPNDSKMHVSHETIYRTLFVQARGALKKELTQYLRTKQEYRKPRTAKKVNYASVVDGISFRERPAEAEDRAVPGHWEGDLLFGTQQSYIVVLVERSTRYCLLGRLTGKDTVTVNKALKRLIRRLPRELWKSLTWDRGSELAGHKAFTVETGLDVYFCDPHSPWQRGSNENTNGLLRQYFPKGEDVSHVTQRQLDAVALRLNTRPRETLGWRSPAQALEQLLR